MPKMAPITVHVEVDRQAAKRDLLRYAEELAAKLRAELGEQTEPTVGEMVGEMVAEALVVADAEAPDPRLAHIAELEAALGRRAREVTRLRQRHHNEVLKLQSVIKELNERIEADPERDRTKVLHLEAQVERLLREAGDLDRRYLHYKGETERLCRAEIERDALMSELATELASAQHGIDERNATIEHLVRRINAIRIATDLSAEMR